MNDIERKVYTIIYHIRGTKNQHTNMKELSRLTGCTEEQLIPIVEIFVKRHLILWDQNRTGNLPLKSRHNPHFSHVGKKF